MRISTRLARCAAFGGLVTLGAAACISPESPIIQDGTKGCSELSGQSDLMSLKVDERVRQMMLATKDLRAVIDTAKVDVRTACGNIAADLGATDTWSGIQDENAAISNKEGTGACDQAAKKLEGLLTGTTALISISLVKGACHTNFDEIKQCDQQCKTTESCDSGTVETRCEPAALSVVCSGSCSAQATCVGTATVAANCTGRCDAQCTGACSGTCIHEDGSRTENDTNCTGQCTATCTGQCRGECKIEASAGVQCGANVRCTAGCTTEYTDPVCTSRCGPPKCTLDTNCYDVCTTRVEAHQICEPAYVDVLVDVSKFPQFAPVVATLKKNMPALIDAAEKQGKRALDALKRLSQAGKDLEGRVDTLDGKSTACAAESAQVLAKSIDTGDVLVNASIKVNVAVKGPTQ